MNVQLSEDDYFRLIQVTEIASFCDCLNELKNKYLQPNDVKIDKESDEEVSIPLGDCIETEIDATGLLLGFKLRPEMVDLMHWKNDFDLAGVLKVMKTVNLMSRLLKNGDLTKKDIHIQTVK